MSDSTTPTGQTFLPSFEARRMIRLRGRVPLRSMAATVGCSVMAVSQWERGTEPRVQWRERYARELQRIADIVGAFDL